MVCVLSRDYLLNPFVERHGKFLVLRDDLLAGGTKVRALNSLIPEIDASRIVYPSSSTGAGAWALTEVCNRHGKEAVLFFDRGAVERWDDAVKLCADLGATIQFSDENGREARSEAARIYASKGAHQHFFPPGFDVPEFRLAMGEAFRGIVDACDPPEIWVSSSSGSISRSLQQAMPERQHCVVIVSDDKNIDVGNAKVFHAREKFNQVAFKMPPFPSCEHYDAKGWYHFTRKAPAGSLFINVAGPTLLPK